MGHYVVFFPPIGYGEGIWKTFLFDISGVWSHFNWLHQLFHLTFDRCLVFSEKCGDCTFTKVKTKRDLLA